MTLFADEPFPKLILGNIESKSKSHLKTNIEMSSYHRPFEIGKKVQYADTNMHLKRNKTFSEYFLIFGKYIVTVCKIITVKVIIYAWGKFRLGMRYA